MFFTVDGRAIGQSQAGADGRFRSPLAVSTLPVGSYQVEARCGVVIFAPLDVVLASQVYSGSSTVLVVVFFCLIGAALFFRRLASH